MAHFRATGAHRRATTRTVSRTRQQMSTRLDHPQRGEGARRSRGSEVIISLSMAGAQWVPPDLCKTWGFAGFTASLAAAGSVEPQVRPSVGVQTPMPAPKHTL